MTPAWKSADAAASLEGLARLRSLRAIASARRRGLAARMGFMLVGAVALTYFGAPVAAIIWTAGSIITQIAAAAAFGRFERAGETLPPSRAELTACHATLFAAGFWHSGLAAPLWLAGGEAGRLLALAWVCGALGHAMLHVPADDRLLASATAGHLAQLVITPAAALALGDAAELAAAASLLGAVVFVAYVAVTLVSRGHVAGVLGATRELAREEDRRAEAANARTERLLDAVAHELRPPMIGALGLSRLLLDTELPPRQRRLARSIHDAGEMSLSMLDEIAECCRIDGGQRALEESEVDLRKLVAGLVELWRPRVEEKGLRLESVVDAQAPSAIRVDGPRLRQLVSNMLANAVRLTDVGEIRLHVGASRVDAGSATLWVAVTDTGRGIEPERVEDLFESFGGRAGSGGLGLAIARRLARLMGGEVTVSSAVGVGTRFKLEAPVEVVSWPVRSPRIVIDFVEPEGRPSLDRLDIALEDVTGVDPLADERLDPPPALSPPDDGEPGEAGRPRPRICVVEDRPLNRRVIEAALRGLDCELIFAVDGEDALELIGAHELDLIFMDLHMPGVDGFDVTRRVRQGGGVNARTPIVGLTANVLAGVREACAAAGMDDFIPKPIDLDALHDVVRRHLPQTVPAATRAGAVEDARV